MRAHLAVAVAATICIAACGEKPPPLPGDPPRVTVQAVSATIADTKLTVNLTVSGCNEVKNLSLWNRDVHVADVPYKGNPTTYEIAPNNLRYSSGLAADVALVARVRCDDDRQNASNPAAVRFLPVAEVIRPQPGAQVVTDVFWAVGQGPHVGFIGCSGTGGGSTAFVRVSRGGEVTHFNQTLPFNCSASTWITELHLATGLRWAVEPGQGAFAFKENMTVVATFVGNVRHLTVGPDGDALIYAEGPERLVRVRSGNEAMPGGQVLWTFAPAGRITGNVGVQSDAVYVPMWVDNLGTQTAALWMQRLSYASGGSVGAVELKSFQYGVGDIPNIPPVAFSADASIAYFALKTHPTASTVFACATNAAQAGCTGSDLKWQKGPLPGHVLLTVPYFGRSIVAAVAPQHTWFLSAANGDVLNKGGEPIQPEGALVTMGVQPGHGKDFYILSGSGQPGTLPTEIIAVDAPEFGQLFRYSLHGGNLMAGVDDSGQLWMRVNTELVRTLPLAEYQLVVNR